MPARFLSEGLFFMKMLQAWFDFINRSAKYMQAYGVPNSESLPSLPAVRQAVSRTIKNT